MKIDTMTLQAEDHVKNANIVKDIVLGQLLEDKIITKEQADKYADDYQIIIVKPSWFQRWAEKVNISDTMGYIYKYVKF